MYDQFFFSIDTFSALMAVCCSKCDTEERLVLCARLLIEHGAVVNAHDRYIKSFEAKFALTELNA